MNEKTERSQDVASHSIHELVVPASASGERIDRFLASQDIGLSRSRIKGLMERGEVEMDGTACRSPSRKLKGGERITVRVPPPEPLELVPCPVEFGVLYEDGHLAVVDKPAGLVVHPGAGREEKTLVHGLLHRCPDLSGIGGVLRPGIVHRLDKDTSGVMVVAKSATAHERLAEAFKKGCVEKRYLALVKGKMPALEGEVDRPIGRHPVHRKKMAADAPSSRNAVTLWRVEEEFQGASLLSIRILTGRTHQIRAHMEHLGHPLLGDPLYGGPRRMNIGGKSVEIQRQMLHAASIAFTHPISGARLEFGSPLPRDFSGLLELFRQALIS